MLLMLVEFALIQKCLCETFEQYAKNKIKEISCKKFDSEKMRKDICLYHYALLLYSTNTSAKNEKSMKVCTLSSWRKVLRRRNVDNRLGCCHNRYEGQHYRHMYGHFGFSSKI